MNISLLHSKATKFKKRASINKEKACDVHVQPIRPVCISLRKLYAAG